MNYSKNKINGVIIDYDLVGLVLDAKTERLNNEIVSKDKTLSIKTTVNPNWYDNSTEAQRLFWMSKEKEYLEKLQRQEVLPGVLE